MFFKKKKEDPNSKELRESMQRILNSARQFDRMTPEERQMRRPAKGGRLYLIKDNTKK